MKDREIQALLLTHYLFSMEALRGCETLEEAISLSETLGVDDGLCISAAYFELDIMDSNWVYLINPRNKQYWGPIPFYQKTLPDFFAAIQLRIDNLQKLLGE